jgi:hypothetical protein
MHHQAYHSERAKRLETFAYKIILYLIIIWAIAEAFIVRWMLKAKPNEAIIRKYSKKIISLSQRPFRTSWVKSVAPEDIRLLQTYQYRIRVWFLSIIIPFIAIFAYLWLDIFTKG